MKIIETQSALLTNHEALIHSLEVRADYDGTDGKGNKREMPPNLRAINTDVINYLQSPDLPLGRLIAKHPDRPLTLYKGPHSLFQALGQKYKLNKLEYLQIFNLRPRSQVMLELVLEEAGSRFTEEEMEDILAIIAKVFDEDEADIEPGAEDVVMKKVPAENKLDSRKPRKNYKRRVPVPQANE